MSRFEHRSRRGVSGACVLVLAPAVASGYFGGPPDGHAGDPPANRNCTECHSSYPVNSGPGILELQGLPDSYAPDHGYPLRVVLTQPNRSLWGFELTVIRESDLLQAGELLPVDPSQVQISVGTGTQRDYAKHRGPGTQEGEPAGEWDLFWTAPAPGAGPVRFYVAGNVANNNGSPVLDYIYTIEAGASELLPAQVIGDGSRPGAPALRVWPQPARDEVWVQPASDARVSSTWRLIDSSGRLRDVWEVGEGADARVHALSVAAGIYWLAPVDRSLPAQRLIVVR